MARGAGGAPVWPFPGAEDEGTPCGTFWVVGSKLIHLISVGLTPAQGISGGRWVSRVSSGIQLQLVQAGAPEGLRAVPHTWAPRRPALAGTSEACATGSGC